MDDLKGYAQQVNLFERKYDDEVLQGSELSWHKAAVGGYFVMMPREEIVKSAVVAARNGKPPSFAIVRAILLLEHLHANTIGQI